MIGWFKRLWLRASARTMSKRAADKQRVKRRMNEAVNRDRRKRVNAQLLASVSNDNQAGLAARLSKAGQI